MYCLMVYRHYVTLHYCITLQYICMSCHCFVSSFVTVTTFSHCTYYIRTVYILPTLSSDALATTSMSTVKLFHSTVVVVFTVVVFVFFVFLLNTSQVEAQIQSQRQSQTQSQEDEAEGLDFIQRFVHPIVSEDSTLDTEPFQPHQQKPVGFPGVRVLCKCGIQNGKNAPKTIERKRREQEYYGKVEKNTRDEEDNSDDESQVWKDLNRGRNDHDHDHEAEPESEPATQSLSLPQVIPFVSEGVEAEINEYPWIVALIYNLSNGTQVHFCGGTLFSSKYILTATHCLSGKSIEKTEVWLNEHDILLSTETPGGTLQVKAKRFIVHPKYNSIMHYNDISIIELEEEIDIKKSYYRPLCLPSPNFDPSTSLSGVEGVAAGWGQTFFHGPKSAKLLKVSLPILSNEGCVTKSEPFYKKRLTDYMICAGDIAFGGRDTCPGDSGGPLFVTHRGKNVLVGIVSWGYRCGEPKKPGVYTRVSKYISWINQETSNGQRCAG